jgi:hypothetical protein
MQSRQQQQQQQQQQPLQKFTLYETRSRLYVVGSSLDEVSFSILKIDRTLPYELDVTEDSVTYSKPEMVDLLNMIDHGNKGSGGGLRKVAACFGIIGCVAEL